jgi:hypothetical protein
MALRIISDPATMEMHRRAPHNGEFPLGEIEVYRPPIHVLAIFCHTLAVLAEIGICRGRAIRGYDMKGIGCVHCVA